MYSALIIALMLAVIVLSVAVVWACDKINPPVEHPDVKRIQWPVGNPGDNRP